MRIDDENGTALEPTTGGPQTVAELLAESEVKVIGIDRERDCISQSIRQMQADPWSRIGSEIQVGQDLDATVGDRVRVRVAGIDAESRRLSLSVRQAAP